MESRLQAGYDAAREEASRGIRRAEATIAEYPATSVLASFGLGFGLGLVVMAVVSRPEESWYNWTERHGRESMHHAQESMKRLPDAFVSLTESIRSLPETIAQSVRGAAKHFG